MQRKDDYAARRTHLADLSEAELEQRFWRLAEQIVDPLIELAHNHTTPSVERSVLLRMGLSSLESKDLVQQIWDRGLLGKGAGHVVHVLAQKQQSTIREAAESLLAGQGWDTVEAHFQRRGN